MARLAYGIVLAKRIAFLLRAVTADRRDVEHASAILHKCTTAITRTASLVSYHCCIPARCRASSAICHAPLDGDIEIRNVAKNEVDQTLELLLGQVSTKLLAMDQLAVRVCHQTVLRESVVHPIDVCPLLDC